MKLLIHRRNIRKMIVYFCALKCKHSRNDNEPSLNDCKTPLIKEIIVDDNMKRNALIVDV